MFLAVDNDNGPAELCFFNVGMFASRMGVAASQYNWFIHIDYNWPKAQRMGC